MKDPPVTDNNDLAGFGYRQELKRSMGSFSSFAAGFSYISILTGLFQMFHLGYGVAGPAFFWKPERSPALHRRRPPGHGMAEDAGSALGA